EEAIQVGGSMAAGDHADLDPMSAIADDWHNPHEPLGRPHPAEIEFHGVRILSPQLYLGGVDYLGRKAKTKLTVKWGGHPAREHAGGGPHRYAARMYGDPDGVTLHPLDWTPGLDDRARRHGLLRQHAVKGAAVDGQQLFPSRAAPAHLAPSSARTMKP